MLIIFFLLVYLKKLVWYFLVVLEVIRISQWHRKRGVFQVNYALKCTCLACSIEKVAYRPDLSEDMPMLVEREEKALHFSCTYPIVFLYVSGYTYRYVRGIRVHCEIT